MYTNVSILHELNLKTRLSFVCLEKVLDLFGHIAGNEGNSLEQSVVKEKVDTKR